MIREGEAGLKNLLQEKMTRVLLCRAAQRMSSLGNAIRDTTSQAKVGKGKVK